MTSLSSFRKMSQLHWKPRGNRGQSNSNWKAMRYHNYHHQSSFNQHKYNHHTHNTHTPNNQRDIAAQNAIEYLSKNKHLYQKNGGLWTFSFGANMDPWKLETKRDIQPIGKKLRGKLIGWRLLFDHKGGFANVIKVINDKNHNFK
eukprot:512266_1